MGTQTRLVTLSREGDYFRLSFRYDEELVSKVRSLPFARFDSTTKTWLVAICDKAVDELRTMHYPDGLLDLSPDDWLDDGEVIPKLAPAVLRSGTTRRPYMVHTAYRDERITNRLKAVPTCAFSSSAKAWTFGPQAAAGLADLVRAKLLDDPEKLLSATDQVIVVFDIRTGGFRMLHGDANIAKQAQAAFNSYFPGRDVVAEWKENGHQVGFADAFSEEVYRGLLLGDGGIQPEGFLIDLYPYQQHGVALGLIRSGLLIADEAGLGKTAQAIGVGSEALRKGEVKRVLMIVPGHLRSQWEAEIRKFLGEGENIVVVDGTPTKRKAQYEAGSDARWVIVHYDVLHRDIELVKPLAKDALMVVDEAHRIRNSRTKRSKAVRGLGKLAPKRLALSATAIENSPDEWYWVLSGFAVPNLFGSFTDFADRYMYPGAFGGYEGARNIDDLAVRSKAHFLRRRKRDVAAFLPPLRVQHLPLDPEPAYAALLRRAHRDAKEEIAATRMAHQAAHAKQTAMIEGSEEHTYDELVDATAGMTAVGMLRMLCSSPRLLRASDSESAEALIDAGLVPDLDGPKLDELRVMAAEFQAAGERLVVFTFFERMAELIAERFTEDGIRHVIMTGSSSRAARDEAVRRFTDPDDAVTVFVSTDAGAEGLNLGKTCSTLVNIDLPWTAGRLEQRANRIHRLDGSHPHYQVINMTLRGTIEHGILQRIEHKADLADAILGDSDGRARTTGRPVARNPVFDAFDDWGP